MNRYKKAVLAIGLGILAMGVQASDPIVQNGYFTDGGSFWNAGNGTPTFNSGVATLTGSDEIYQSISFDNVFNWGESYAITFTSSGTGTGKVSLYDLGFALSDGHGLLTLEPITFGGTGTHTYYFSTGSALNSKAPSSNFPYTHLDFFAATDTISIDNVSISAVPEPESWAMLLVGLTAVGGLARRRKAGQVTG